MNNELVIGNFPKEMPSDDQMLETVSALLATLQRSKRE